MPCACADGWATTLLANEQGLTWRIASKADAQALKTFVETGGSGSPSIDKFAGDELARQSSERYSNSHLLLNARGEVVAFASNSMGIVELESEYMMEKNMEMISQVPVLFLHRLGVLKGEQRKGYARLLIFRIFETLRHTCGHTAAHAVALYVEPGNAPAKKLYASMFFEPVKTKKTRLELYLLPYPEAVEQLRQIENRV
jgi:GNAT superfamily N-acetyltransferase